MQAGATSHEQQEQTQGYLFRPAKSLKNVFKLSWQVTAKDAMRECHLATFGSSHVLKNTIVKNQSSLLSCFDIFFSMQQHCFQLAGSA